MTDNAPPPKERTRAPGGGRKKSFDTDDVLVQAVDIFWQHGFADTSIRQLEDELGLTASSIYNTFGSKHDMLDAAVEKYLGLMDRVVLSELRDADDPLTGLTEFFHRVSIGVDGEHRWGCFVVSLLTENAGRDEQINARTGAYFDTLRSEFESALRRAQAAELLTPELGTGDFESWVQDQANLLLVNLLGINTAARGRMGNAVVDSLTASVQMQIESWRSD